MSFTRDDEQLVATKQADRASLVGRKTILEAELAAAIEAKKEGIFKFAQRKNEVGLVAFAIASNIEALQTKKAKLAQAEAAAQAARPADQGLRHDLRPPRRPDRPPGRRAVHAPRCGSH